MFKNRREAGRQLAEHLLKYKQDSPVVVALPRGGVPVGYEVARLLEAPLDILMVRKLGCPGQPELAIGAITEGDQWEIVVNSEVVEQTDLSAIYLEHEVAEKLDEMQKMKVLFRGHHPPVQLSHRTVIVVDDGIATGATVRVVVKRIRREKPRKLVVATPVASHEAIDLLTQEADEVICLEIPKFFEAVGGSYIDFRPVPDKDVVRYLNLARESINTQRMAV